MKRLSGEDKAGLYITVIVHLTVIIVLLLFRIGAVLKEENSFVLDFTREEALERMAEKDRAEKAKEEFSDEISRRIDELIAGESGVSFRNVATDRGQLKDDRGTDAEQLYKDAERLAQELRDGVHLDEPDEDYAAVKPASPSKAEKKPAAEYSGPSVVSYSLEGRKASKLPIPAYRCYGGGMVTVIIVVDNAGNVISAKVQDDVSSPDKCLREFAVRAARLSKFSSSPKAPARQLGDIVYQFIAQ
jgi:hypothetical protein